MRIQQAKSRPKVAYSFESEDFEQWSLSSLNADDEPEDEYESAFEDETLADNVIEFLQEAATR